MTTSGINRQSYAYGASRSSIREIAAYGSARKAEIGAQNVFDFSLGNPSIPAPDAVRASIERSRALPPVELHGYTPANGLPFVRDAVASSLNGRFGTTSPVGPPRRSPSRSTPSSTPVTRSS